jgi:hypothetical protein
VSLLLNSVGTLQEPKSTRLTTTALTTVWTPSDFETGIQVVLANETAGAVVANVYWNNGTTDYLLIAKSVPANDHVVVEVAIRLISGHLLKAQAPATANAITVSVITAKSQRLAGVS